MIIGNHNVNKQKQRTVQRLKGIIILLYLCSADIVNKGFTADLLSKLMAITFHIFRDFCDIQEREIRIDNDISRVRNKCRNT